MRIGIDGIHISRNMKGIGRVETSIVETLASHTFLHEFVVLTDKEHSQLGLPESDSISYYVDQCRTLLEWEQIRLPRAIRKLKIDCLITLADRIPHSSLCPIIMYLFEIPEIRRRLSIERGSAGRYQLFSDLFTKFVFPMSLKKSRYIAVSSEFTRKELTSNYQVDPSKISVVPAAISKRFFCSSIDQFHRSSMQHRFDASDGYVVSFSSGDVRENIEISLCAFAEANISKNIKMILVGDVYPQNIINQLDLQDRVLSVGYVSDDELLDIYRGADAYLDASLYEGFGLQVLEAMACGVPELCSEIDSLLEIVGESALTYNCTDVVGFSKGLELVFNSNIQSKQMIDEGLRLASQYSWLDTVMNLIELCELSSNSID